MADMEVHEHLMVNGREARCRAALRHENVHSLDRYIEKHNAYSNWSAEIILQHRRGSGEQGGRPARLLGNQAERRRWLNQLAWRLPAAGLLFPVLRFLWFYLVRLGFLDGRAGFYYCGFKAVQAFHIMAKVAERE